MLNDIQEIIMTSRKLGVSDIHISEGMEMRVRIDGNLIPAPFEVDMGSMKDLVFLYSFCSYCSSFCLTRE